MSYEIRIRRQVWDRYCNLAGLRTRSELAAKIGVDVSTVTRMLNNNRTPGPRVIAGAVGAFNEDHKVDKAQVFAELFEVVGVENSKAA